MRSRRRSEEEVLPTVSVGLGGRRRAAEAVVTPPPPPTGNNLRANGYYMLGSERPPTAHINDYDLIITAQGSTTTGNARGLSLRYAAAMHVTSATTSWNYGVGWAQASANDWILRDSGGNLVYNGNYLSKPSGWDTYQGDISSPGYMQAFADNLIAWCQARGIDGFYNDDTLGDPRQLSSQWPVKFANTAAWQAAYVNFMDYVADRCHAAGLRYFGNAFWWDYTGAPSRNNDVSAVREWWAALNATSVDGLMAESWLHANISDPYVEARRIRGSGAEWYNNWDNWCLLIREHFAAGKAPICLSYLPLTATSKHEYTLASFYLEWDGVSDGWWGFKAEPGDITDPWLSTLYAKLPLGAATSGRFQTAGTWRKNYEYGYVQVDPVNRVGSVVRTA